VETLLFHPFSIHVLTKNMAQVLHHCQKNFIFASHSDCLLSKHSWKILKIKQWKVKWGDIEEATECTNLHSSACTCKCIIVMKKKEEVGAMSSNLNVQYIFEILSC
jgi:hypothetical protein